MIDKKQEYLDEINKNLKKLISAAQQQGRTVEVETQVYTNLILKVDGVITTKFELTPQVLESISSKSMSNKLKTRIITHPKLKSRYPIKERIHYQHQRKGAAPVSAWWSNDPQTLALLNVPATAVERAAHPVLAKRLDKLKLENDELNLPHELVVPAVQHYNWLQPVQPPIVAADAEEFADVGI